MVGNFMVGGPNYIPFTIFEQANVVPIDHIFAINCLLINEFNYPCKIFYKCNVKPNIYHVWIFEFLDLLCKLQSDSS